MFILLELDYFIPYLLLYATCNFMGEEILNLGLGNLTNMNFDSNNLGFASPSYLSNNKESMDMTMTD
jgi:hypothetical protein